MFLDFINLKLKNKKKYNIFFDNISILIYPQNFRYQNFYYSSKKNYKF